MIRRPPRSTLDRSSAASDVYKRQLHSTSFYFKTFVIGIIVMGVFVNLLGIAGNGIAKKKWLPIIVEKQAEIFELSLIHISEPTRPY